MSYLKNRKKYFSFIILFFTFFHVHLQLSISAELTGNELLEKISKDSFKFFWEKANPNTGLIPDSSTSYSPCSIAAVGFGLTAICIGVENKWITKNEAYNRILKILKYFYHKIPNEHGFYYHFLNMNDGSREWSSELSSIDTALFVAGALVCAEYFKRTEIEEIANKLYDRIDWVWMLNNRKYLCMGWKPDEGFLNYYWDSLNESMILYALAIGSRNHPIPVTAWNSWKRPEGTYGDYTYYYCNTGSLFIYQFSHAWIDFRERRDKFTNYWENSVKATLVNQKFCLDNSDKFSGYSEFSWGLSACLGPDGYKGYGGGPDNPLHDGTIAPSAVAGSLPFCPELCLKTLENFYNNSKLQIYGQYGFFDGFNLDKNWVSNDFLGIDLGITLLMIENYRTNFVWKYFMRHPAIKKWAKNCLPLESTE